MHEFFCVCSRVKYPDMGACGTTLHTLHWVDASALDLMVNFYAIQL